MIPYWLLFGMWTAGAVHAHRRQAWRLDALFFLIAATLTTLMIGLRFEVGGDWFNYLRIYNDLYFSSLFSAITTTDIGYGALNWIAAQTDLGVVFINFVCAILFLVGFGHLCRRQPNPYLAVLVGVPYLIIVVAMGYTRQAAAIGVICFAIADASERHILRLVILIGVAALMHKTALLVLPVALYPIFRRNLLLGGIGFALFAGLFVLVLRDSADKLVTNYVHGNLDSQGALVRISMNVVAACVFLAIRNRVNLPPFQKTFWTVCAVLSILSLAALLSASASAGIDRLALYMAPLQAVTYSRLPYSLNVKNKETTAGSASAIIGIILYSAAVQFVWLNYATYASAWLPYKNFIFVKNA